MKTSTSFFSKTWAAAFILAASNLIVGCANSSGPSSGSFAGAGSTFIFKDYEIDTSGNLSFPILEMDSVEATGMQIGGMVNVSRIGERTGGQFTDFDYFI